MIYSLSEINRISGSRLAVKDRIYTDVNGNKYRGTSDNRLEQIFTSDKTIGVQLSINEPETSLKDYLTNLTNSILVSLGLKQDVLISGTNIKTVNNESLLGEGNLDITGGLTQQQVEGLI
jgi:hypothetical protein